MLILCRNHHAALKHKGTPRDMDRNGEKKTKNMNKVVLPGQVFSSSTLMIHLVMRQRLKKDCDEGEES